MTEIVTDNPLVKLWVWGLDITWRYWYIWLVLLIVWMWLVVKRFKRQEKFWEELNRKSDKTTEDLRLMSKYGKKHYLFTCTPITPELVRQFSRIDFDVSDNEIKIWIMKAFERTEKKLNCSLEALKDACGEIPAGVVQYILFLASECEGNKVPDDKFEKAMDMEKLIEPYKNKEL